MVTRARYDEVVDFYADQIGDTIADPAALAVLDLAAPDLPGARVLDLACGAGRSSRALARAGATVTGIDISANMVAIAQAAEQADPLGIDYLVVDATTDPQVGGPYHGVVCLWGLTDIDDLAGTLDTVAAALRPSGFFAACLLHPCFPGLGTEIAGSYPPTAGYFTEGWWTPTAGRSGLRQRVGATHRTLATYLNALTTRGLQLETVREPAPSPDWFGAHQPVPTYLALRCHRA